MHLLVSSEGAFVYDDKTRKDTNIENICNTNAKVVDDYVFLLTFDIQYQNNETRQRNKNGDTWWQKREIVST